MTVSAEQLAMLEQLACDKIRSWARAGDLETHKYLHLILCRWREWGDEEEVRDCVQVLTRNEDGLVEFITSFMYGTTSHGLSDYVSSMTWRISLKGLEAFIDLGQAALKLREIQNAREFANKSEEQRRTISVFLDTVDGKIKNYPWE